MASYIASKDCILRTVMDENILVPTGNQIAVSNRILKLNPTAAFLWQQLETPKSVNELAEKLGEQFDVEDVIYDIILSDVKQAITELLEEKVIFEVKNA